MIERQHILQYLGKDLGSENSPTSTDIEQLTDQASGCQLITQLFLSGNGQMKLMMAQAIRTELVSGSEHICCDE